MRLLVLRNYYKHYFIEKCFYIFCPTNNLDLLSLNFEFIPAILKLTPPACLLWFWVNTIVSKTKLARKVVEYTDCIFAEG